MCGDARVYEIVAGNETGSVVSGEGSTRVLQVAQGFTFKLICLYI